MRRCCILLHVVFLLVLGLGLVVLHCCVHLPCLSCLLSDAAPAVSIHAKCMVSEMVLLLISAADPAREWAHGECRA
jgi:hypothetical protein